MHITMGSVFKKLKIMPGSCSVNVIISAVVPDLAFTDQLNSVVVGK